MNTRLESITKNIVSSIINKLIIVISPFIMRTIIIYKLGAEYMGLNGLFTSILGVLSITELGFGNAVIYNLYKPIAEGDTQKINALLSFYRQVYKIIGVIIFIIGLLLMPFLKYFIKGSCPADINLYVLYLLYLGDIVIGYLFCAYKKSLLIADQRSDLDNNLNSITNILCFVLQLLGLLFFNNYYCYVVVIPMCTLFNNFMISKTVSNRYPQYKAYGNISGEEKRQIKKKVQALFYNKVGATILNSADNIVISAFLGLSMLTYYNNYYGIVYAFISLAYMVTSSITAVVANSIIKDSLEKNRHNFYIMNFMMSVVSGLCFVCFLNLLQPFMEIWMGKERMLPDVTVVLLCIYFYVWQSRRVTAIYRDANGIWELDKYKSLIAAAVNIVTNIILVQFIGINGIVLSTILSMVVVEIPWETYILYKHYFKRSVKEYYIKHLLYLCALLVAALVSYYTCLYITITGVLGLLVKGCLCAGVFAVIYCCAFFHTIEFKESLQYLQKLWKKKK